MLGRGTRGCLSSATCSCRAVTRKNSSIRIRLIWFPVMRPSSLHAMILKDDFRIKIIYENSSQKCKIELNSMFSRNHPACPSIPHIIAMGYRTMVESDPRLNGLQEKLIRAKVPLPSYPYTQPKCNFKGMRRCASHATS